MPELKISGFVFLSFLLFSCSSSSGVPKTALAGLRGKDPVSMGTIEAQTPAPPGEEGVLLSLFYYPEDEVLSIRFLYETVSYRQFWDRNAVGVLTAALSRYEADYNQADFSQKSAGAPGRAYGRVLLMAEWQSFSFSGVFLSYPYLDLGYSLGNAGPCFTLLQREAGEQNFPSRNIKSRRIVLYLSLSEARALSASLNALRNALHADQE